ncbi:MAG TPA: hypothetical protein PK644_06105, partial [bacterium]|nr:hypothetical protein [bacterium]
GGFSDGFLPAVVEKVGPDCFDGISDYCRRKEHAQLIGSLARRYNKSFWSVEYGGYASFFSETEPPDSIGSRDSTQRLLESAIRSLCWGPAEKYLRYDARYPGPYPSYQKYCTMFEYDGSLKAPAVAYSVLNKLLCGYQGQEEIEGDRRLKIFLFQKGEERLVACWSGSGRLYRLVLPERASSWKILDMMGNEVEKEVGQGKVSLLLGPRPVYFCHLKPEDIKVFSAAGLEELLSLTTACVPDEAGILALKVNLKNTLSETASGSLGFSREAQYLLRNPGQRQRFSLQPGQSFSFLFPLNFGQRDVVENKLLELELAGPGLDSYFRQRLSYAGSRKVSFPIEVDGDLKEWTPFLDWTDDRSLRLDRATVNQEKSVRLTGRCLPAWDEEYLYLTFQVSAPEASPEHQLRVYLQPEGRQGTAYQLVFRPFEKPAALYGSLAEKVVWAFKEGQGRNYNLEMKIPWKQVGVTGRAGSSLWFNAVLVQTEGNRLVAEKAWAADLVAGEEKLGLGQLYLIRE